MNYYLIYISYATRPMDEAELVELLNRSRKNNFKRGVTGMLLYLQDKFIQVLEGNEQAVKSLLTIIESDPRHKKVAVLLEGKTKERLFQSWSMGFKNLTDQEFIQSSGYQSPEVFFRQKAITNDSHPVLIFLQLFFKKNWVDYPEPTLT
jgi:acylphosphatase